MEINSLLTRALFFAVTITCAVSNTQASVSEAIRERVESMMFLQRPDIGGVPILSRAILPELYAARQYTPLWPDEEKIHQLQTLADFAYENGLDPADYPLASVQRLLDAPEPLSDRDAADLDLLATETLVRIGYQLRFGKVDANSLFTDWNFERQLQSGVERNRTIEEFVQAPSLLDEMDDWVSDAPIYDLLRKALARYREIQHNGGWDQIPAGPVLRPGDADPRIPALRRRLQVEGDLAPGSSSSQQYDDELTGAVVRFQQRHGLDADGIVGNRSYQTLNVTVEKRIDQLRASLERGRWVMEQAQAAGKHFLLVNIASAQLALMKDGKPEFVARVQVGQPYRQTPVFQGKIQYLVLNPTWTVPPTILAQDVLPRLKENAAAYLAEKHMDLLDRQGSLVDPSQVDWSRMSAKGFPYIVRQRPGSWNSLGQIKFIFPNSHFVFLHDTPSRELFNRTERAFSSGCIRVENPFELAELLMNDPKWNQAAFQQVIEMQKQTTVHLQEPLPIFLMYWTGMADADGTVRFYDDIYGRDAVLLKAMAEPPKIDLPDSGNSRGKS